MVKKWYITLLCFIAFSIVFGKDEFSLPEHLEPVIDITNTLSSSEKDYINQMIRDFSDSKGSQIGVVILPTTDGMPIEEASISIAEAWKLGREGVDDGVLILIIKNDRKIRIEVGYGLEGAIPDIYAKRLIDNVMTPKFKSGDFADGISDGVQSIISLINEEELAGVTTEKKGDAYKLIFAFLMWGVAITVVFFFLRGWWKNITYYCAKDSVSGKLSYILSTYKKVFIIFLGITFILILVFGFTRSNVVDGLTFGSSFGALAFVVYFFFRGYAAGPGGASSSSSYSSGSNSSYSSSSSSSSSSYSGGGGSFGGGGASGSW